MISESSIKLKNVYNDVFTRFEGYEDKIGEYDNEEDKREAEKAASTVINKLQIHLK